MDTRMIRNLIILSGWILLLLKGFILQLAFSVHHSSNDQDDTGTANLQRVLLRDVYRSRRIPLKALTRGKISPSCSSTELVLIRDTVGEVIQQNTITSKAIPKVIHQTSKTRCLAPELASLAQQWQKLEGFDYYFHDDDAVDYLLQQHFPEFPTLSQVLNCIHSPTLKADLWRYVLLWEYGGIYADLDSIPQDVFPTLLQPETDQGFFVVDDYHYLSQYFIALAPRHVLMYYTIQAALSNILLASDTGSINPARTTGPTALHNGLQTFVRDTSTVDMPDALDLDWSQKARGPVEAGVYKGANGFSIRVVGKEDNEVIRREGLKRGQKIIAYQKMGMKHFSKTRQATNTSCLALLYREHNNISW